MCPKQDFLRESRGSCISSPSPPSLLPWVWQVTGHIAAAGLLWRRAQQVDFSSAASISEVYMFVWKVRISFFSERRASVFVWKVRV